MVYQLSQTYPFAYPQAKQTGSLSERGLKTAGTQKILKTQFIISLVVQTKSLNILTLEAHYTIS